MEWAQNNMSFLVNYPISVMTLLVGALLLPSPKVRRFIIALACMIIIGEIGFIVWVAYSQVFGARPPSRAPAQTTSRPTPTPRIQKPTPEPPSSTDQSGSNTSSAVSFYLSSKGDPSIRSTYCLDGEFEGESQLSSGTINVHLGKGN